MQDYSTVIFLGNGYDVASGYKTKYSDFFKDDLFKELCKKDNRLAQFIDEANQKKGADNWSDLEEELFNYSCYLTKIKSNGDPPNLKLPEGKKAWDYNENEKSILSNQNFLADFKDLQDCLGKFILKQTQTSKHTYDQNQESLKFLTRDWLDEDELTLVISFNYTDLFYGTHTKSEMLFVHGSIKTLVRDKNSNKLEPYGQTSTNNIVIGIDEEMKVETAHSFLYKSYNEKTNIHQLSSVLDHAKRFILFGCSLGVSDRWYFEKIFNRQQSGKIYEIYHYGIDDQLSINSRIKEISKDNIADYKERNSILYLDSSSLEGALAKRKEYYTEYPFKP